MSEINLETETSRQLRKATPEDIIIFTMTNTETKYEEMNIQFLINFVINIRKQLPNEWRDVIIDGLTAYTYERGIEEITKDILQFWEKNENDDKSNLVREIYFSF